VTHLCVAVGSLAFACTITTPTTESHLADNLICQTFKRTTKSIVHKLPPYIKSSTQHLLELLKAINFNPSNMSFFSCKNAVSICTHINTKQVLKTLQPFLSALPLCAGCPTNAAIITALDNLMHQNIFKLGNKFWKQKPAPTWVHHRMQIMPNSTTALLLLLPYKRP
jgi:hypothetical protein